jgi:hypothetical protein
MRTLFILLFPVLAWGQTFEIQMVDMDGSFYPSKGSWEIQEELVLVHHLNRTDVYTIQGVLDPKMQNAWKCTKGAGRYGVAYFKLENGTECLYVSEVDGLFTRTYFGKMTKPRK